MTLSSGTRLGVYEIQEAIGSGGMGEVYRARDTRLGRNVAIKVLPVAAAADVERRTRFEREAKAVAALSHPNIVTIHAVEEAEGIPFFAMEYVEGTTLGQMIPAHGLPLAELLRIAIPLTDAVGAAHQRGILHRDIKPANVMITAEGRVKVLDFGLAKLKEAAALQAQAGTQATMEATGEERILGTVAYMSPEQAEGKAVDERSDVFSLGVVLYEMATGQRPFKGDTSVSVISAILKDTPGSVTDLRPDLPRDLVRILKRALNKDPEHRYQSAKDLRNDLETLKEDLDSGEIVRTTAASSRPERRRRWLVLGGCLLVGLLVAGTWWTSRLIAPTRETTAVADFFDDFNLTRLTTEAISDAAVAISPDGRYVAYATTEKGRQGLRVRQAETSATVPVVPPAETQYYDVSFSPDGNWLYYVAYPHGSNQATLYRVSVLGGDSQRLIDDVDRAVTFSPDAKRFAFVRGFPDKGAAILTANADGSGMQTLVTRERPNDFVLVGPAWSPDGRTIAAAAYSGSFKIAIVTIDVATRAVQPVGVKRWDSVAAIAWPRTGSHLIVSAMDYAVADTLQIWEVGLPGGTVRRLTKDIANYTRVSLTADARDLATVRSEPRGTLWVGSAADPNRVDRVASVPDTVTTGTVGGPIRWTPDGQIIYTAVVGGNYDIWAVRPDGGNPRQLTTSAALDGRPAVAPDGRYIAFLSTRDGPARVWRMDPDGGRQTVLTSGPFDYDPLVAADSRSVYFVRLDQPQSPMYSVPIEGGEASLLSGPAPPASPAPWHGVPAGFQPRHLSPEGSLILGTYFDDQQGRARLAIVPVGGQGPVRTPDIKLILGYAVYDWAADARAITFARTTDGVSNLWRQPLDGGPATRLTHYAASDEIVAHAWSRDGKQLALVREHAENQVVLLKDVGRGK